jgi:hypothetical protein
MSEGMGQVTLKNGNGQIVGILDDDRPEVVVNEMVFKSMATTINGFTRMGWIGFELLPDKGIMGPTFTETDFNFGTKLEQPTIQILDEVPVTTERPVIVAKPRAERNTNPVTSSNNLGNIIVKPKKLGQDRSMT